LLNFAPAQLSSSLQVQSVGVDGFYSDSATRGGFTTNDLWLEITGKTNATAFFTIHPPWNATNGVWGLYFKTNMAVPYNWTWLMRNAPGQTNSVMTNLPAAQGFFMLGPPTAIRSGFDTYSLGRLDDVGSQLATLPFIINSFGTFYTNLYVNENGNVTFALSDPNYTPDLTISNEVSFWKPYGMTGMIAPFWADVDSRASGSGVTTYGANTVDGRAAFGVSWINVGYYVDNQGDPSDKKNSFQLVVIDRTDRTNGDFDLEFNYSQIQWESGNASGGTAGLGGSSARAGFANAPGSTFELNGSGTNGTFLDSNLTMGLIHTNFNSSVPGRYVFQFHNGAPLTTP
jgi:hypothetical protein